MKATFSVLISDLSGKAGDVVAAKWKGRPYFRRRVTPANPNTTAQQATRAAMTICTGSWKSFVAKVKTSWTVPAAAYGISGFNGFTKANMTEEIAGNWEHYTSADLTREAVTTVAAAAGIAPGDIDVTWAQGSASATDIMHIAYRTPEGATVTVATDAGTLTPAGTYTISGLTPGATYVVYVTNRNAADKFAASSYTTAAAAS